MNPSFALLFAKFDLAMEAKNQPVKASRLIYEMVSFK